MQLPAQTGKTTAIRRIAVRETSVSRHNGGPINGLSQNDSALMYDGLHGGSKLLPHDPERRKSLRQKHTQRILIESNRNQIVLIVFRVIWSQTIIRLVQNQSEKR